MDFQSHSNSVEQSSSVGPECHAAPPFPAGRAESEFLPRFLKVLVTGGFLLYAGLFGYHAYVLLMFPYDVDNSEGFLIYGGHRLASGGGLYRTLDEPPYLVDNYPPVYPVLLAIGDRLLGTGFLWGRGVCVAATFGIAGLIYLWMRGLAGRRWPAFLSALCFLSFYHVYDWGALARVDMPAIFFSVLGLALVERGKSVGFAAACFVAALCTKQTMFAGPIAAFLFLYYREERRAAFTLLISVGVATCVLYGLVQLLSGGTFFLHVFLYNVNEYRLEDLLIYFRHWWMTYSVLGGMAVFFFLHRWIHRRRDLVVYYLLMSWISALLCGKIGSAPNYLLEMVVATSLSLGFLLAEVDVAERPTRAVLNLLLPILLLAQLLGTMHWPYRWDFAYTPTREDLHEARNVERIVKNSPGPVLAERAGLPLLAGHDPVYEPFMCTQLVRQGLWDETPLLERIAAKEFALILLSKDLSKEPVDRERFTERFAATIKESYEIEQTFRRYVLYRPKSESATRRSGTAALSGPREPSYEPALKTDTISGESTNTKEIPEPINGTTEIPIRTAP